MGAAWRIANAGRTDDPHSPDWGLALPTADEVLKVLKARAANHKGKGYVHRVRGDNWERTVGFTGLTAACKDTMKDMKVGEVLIVSALVDKARWLLRKVEVAPAVVNVPTGNDGIDKLYTLIFDTHKSDFPNAENWGILVKRYIDGTTIWSQHSPWHEDNCTSNAMDIHCASIDDMRRAGDMFVKEGPVAKMLLAGSEWLPGEGWRFVGSYIDHYDHLHVEPLPTRHNLC